MIRRTIASLKASLKTVLGIASPSLEFLAAARSAKCRPCTAPVPPPWYAARGPLEPYETPELAAAARRVRRLIRRHWWALFFEPESSTAAAVRAAMATPPEQTGGTSLLEAVRQLEALGMTPQIDPGYLRETMRRFGVSFDEACPNCGELESVCQCGDLRDCW